MSVFAVEPPSKLTVKSYVSETFNSCQAIQVYLKSFKSPLADTFGIKIEQSNVEVCASDDCPAYFG